MFDHVDSIRTGSLDWIDSPMDFDDLAFLALVECMHESDAALMGKLEQIRSLNERKRELTERLERFTEALEGAKDKDDNQIIPVPGEEGISSDPELSEVFGANIEDDPRYRLLDHPMIKSVLDTHPLLEQVDDLTWTKAEVKAEVDRIRNELEQLNTESSVMLIDLNRLMNKRNEAVQLTSNIVRQSHDTALAIISNFK